MQHPSLRAVVAASLGLIVAAVGGSELREASHGSVRGGAALLDSDDPPGPPVVDPALFPDPDAPADAAPTRAAPSAALPVPTLPPAIPDGETKINRHIPLSVETVFAILFVALIASVPIVIRTVDEKESTKVQYMQAAGLVVWLVAGLYLFTNVVKFSSGAGHFDGIRSLTLVETIYLMAQIITTVGYGDITPTDEVGQVFVGFYVIVAILLIASMVTEMVNLVMNRLEKYAAGRALDEIAEVQEEIVQIMTPRAPVSPPWTARTRAARSLLEKFSQRLTLTDVPRELPVNEFLGACLVFLGFVVGGVLFYANYPGENKTVFQAIYMSIITLSTVGFGAFTSNTEAGKIFGAFWMLFGVAALGAVIATLSTLLMALKDAEVAVPHKEKIKENFKNCCETLGLGQNTNQRKPPNMMVSKYEFMVVALRQLDIISDDDVKAANRSFKAARPDQGGTISFKEFRDRMC